MQIHKHANIEANLFCQHYNKKEIVHCNERERERGGGGAGEGRGRQTDRDRVTPTQRGGGGWGEGVEGQNIVG